MNGTVIIEHWTVTIDGETTRIRGKVHANREKRETLKRQARAMLGFQKPDGNLDWGKVDEMALATRARGPISPNLNRSSRHASEAKDSSLEGSWGRPKNNRWGPTWVNANCLRAAIATMRGLNIKRVPDPMPSFYERDWLAHYNDKLKRSCCLRLEETFVTPLHRKPWIAVLESGEVDHAVVCRDELITHDPNNEQMNGATVPRDRLRYGLLIENANAPRYDRWGAVIR